MTLQPHELKKLATLAKLHTPAQLRQKAELFIKVLMIQHDCLMVDLLTDRDNHALENTGALMSASQDRRQLDIALSVLHAVDVDYERASPDAVEAYLNQCQDRALFDLEKSRAWCEHSFNATNDD